MGLVEKLSGMAWGSRRWGAAPAIAGVVALSFAGMSCGDEESVADARLEATVERLQNAFDAADLGDICGMMSEAARRQVITAGHGSSPSCEVGLRPFAEGIEKRRREGEERPELGDVRIQATVEFDVGKHSTAHVTFVEEGGVWRLNSLFGTAPEPSQSID